MLGQATIKLKESEEMERKKLTPEEVERIIEDKKTIFAIEGMSFTDEELEMSRKFLLGEITKEEYEKSKFKKA